MTDHVITLQRLRTALKDDISTEGRRFLDAQKSLLLAILAAIRVSRFEESDNLGRLSQRLDDVDRRIMDSSNNLRDILEDQKIAVRVCQLHLESIQDMAQNISQSIPQSDQQPDQQVCTDAKGDWLELLCTAGIFVGAFIGVSNMLSIQSLHDRGFARQPQQTQHQVWTGSDARVRETPSIRSTSTGSQDPDMWQCHLCSGGPHLYKTTPACTFAHDGTQCGHKMCSMCKMHGFD